MQSFTASFHFWKGHRSKPNTVTPRSDFMGDWKSDTGWEYFCGTLKDLRLSPHTTTTHQLSQVIAPLSVSGRTQLTCQLIDWLTIKDPCPFEVAFRVQRFFESVIHLRICCLKDPKHFGEISVYAQCFDELIWLKRFHATPLSECLEHAQTSLNAKHLPAAQSHPSLSNFNFLRCLWLQAFQAVIAELSAGPEKAQWLETCRTYYAEAYVNHIQLQQDTFERPLPKRGERAYSALIQAHGIAGAAAQGRKALDKQDCCLPLNGTKVLITTAEALQADITSTILYSKANAQSPEDTTPKAFLPSHLPVPHEAAAATPHHSTQARRSTPRHK